MFSLWVSIHRGGGLLPDMKQGHPPPYRGYIPSHKTGGMPPLDMGLDREDTPHWTEGLYLPPDMEYVTGQGVQIILFHYRATCSHVVTHFYLWPQSTYKLLPEISFTVQLNRDCSGHNLPNFLEHFDDCKRWCVDVN